MMAIDVIRLPEHVVLVKGMIQSGLDRHSHDSVRDEALLNRERVSLLGRYLDSVNADAARCIAGSR